MVLISFAMGEILWDFWVLGVFVLGVALGVFD